MRKDKRGDQVTRTAFIFFMGSKTDLSFLNKIIDKD